MRKTMIGLCVAWAVAGSVSALAASIAPVGYGTGPVGAPGLTITPLTLYAPLNPARLLRWLDRGVHGAPINDLFVASEILASLEVASPAVQRRITEACHRIIMTGVTPVSLVHGIVPADRNRKAACRLVLSR
jgi:hypothetical protein